MEDIVSALNELDQKDLWDYVVILNSIVSTILLFFTYYLARKINKKIDKPIIEKQLTRVYELIEVLQKTSFNIGNVEIKDNIRPLGENLEIKFFEFSSMRSHKYPNNELIVQKTYYEKLKFIAYFDDPFIPKKIARLLEKIKFDFEEKYIEKNSKYLVIGSSEMFAMSDINNDYEDFFFPSKSIRHFDDFVKILNNIIEEIIRWINNPKVDLNLK